VPKVQFDTRQVLAQIKDIDPEAAEPYLELAVLQKSEAVSRFHCQLYDIGDKTAEFQRGFRIPNFTTSSSLLTWSDSRHYLKTMLRSGICGNNASSGTCQGDV
jgi:hypothetical protein